MASTFNPRLDSTTLPQSVSTGTSALDKLLAQLQSGTVGQSPNPATTTAAGSAGAATATAPALKPVPVAPTIDSMAVINDAIPGFSGLSQRATQRIDDLMAGKLPQDVQGVMRQAAAQQAQASGMPGSNMIAGTLQGNRTLRDIGRTSLEAGQQGFNDLLSMLQAYSGTVAPSANAALSAQVAREGQATEQAMQTQRLDQAAAEFQKSFGLSEKQLAQQLGISEAELAYKLASLAQNKELATQELNQAASQFQQNRQVSPVNLLQAATSGAAPQGTLATLLAKYGQSPMATKTVTDYTKIV